MRWVQLAVLVIFSMAPAPAGAEAPRPPVLRFQLPASDGYTLQVKTQGALTHVSVWRGDREFATTYDVADSAHGSEIDADLGMLGRIHVQFNPSGLVRMVRIGNSNCWVPRELGTFTGTISFQGENDYTSVEAVSVPGLVGTEWRGRCGVPKAASSAPSALERRAVERVWAVSDAMLMSRSPFSAETWSSTMLLVSAEGRAARYLAYRVELAGPKLTIFRRAGAVAARSTFAYIHTLRRATLAPPAPFSGEATYSARRHRLSGDLTVQFPGVPPETLTGPLYEARMRTLRSA